MQRASKFLADYVTRKGMVKDEDREIYEYGFLLLLELRIFALFCILIMVCLQMYVGGIMFFVVFAPLRVYAGGLHLGRYWQCLVLSCLTFLTVMLIGKYIYIPAYLSAIALIVLEILVYLAYPVENVNRKVDECENRYFKIRLGRFLGFDFVLGLLCVLTDRSDYLLQIVVVFIVVVITMFMGKCKNSRQNGFSIT